MLSPSLFRCCTTQSMAAMTCETSVAPSLDATLIETIRAPGAAPTKAWSYSSSSLPGGIHASRPAIRPAMWVP